MTTAEVKIHILYLVKNAPGVSYQMLLDKCMESLYIDFFDFSQSYNELIAGNLMDKTEIDTGTGEVIGINETLTITPGGNAILNDLIITINKQTMGYLIKAANELSEKVKISNIVKSFIEFDKEKNQYKVKLINETNGFFCSFYVDDKDGADRVCKAWRDNSMSYIQYILKRFDL